MGAHVSQATKANTGILITQVKELGIVLGHGSNAADWNGKFLTELAAALASEGDMIASGTSTMLHAAPSAFSWRTMQMAVIPTLLKDAMPCMSAWPLHHPFIQLYWQSVAPTLLVQCAQHYIVCMQAT